MHRRTLIISLLLCALTIAVYWQVRNHDFINFDDPTYVTENPYVQEGLSRRSIVWAFTSTSYSVWIPLTWLSLMLNYALFGLNPGGYHLTNLLLHLANVLLLFVVLKRITGAVWQSGFVAALFAIHPLHVESVAWVSERKDVLSTLFWILTIWAYSHYVEHRGFRRYLLTLFTFALGLMAKPMLVTLPFVLLLLDFWPLGRLPSAPTAAGNSPPYNKSIISALRRQRTLHLVLEKTPLLFLATIFSVVTFIAQLKSGAVKSFVAFPLTDRFANALVSYVKYMAKMIWPQNMAVFYPHPGSSLALWQVIAAGILLASLSIAVTRSAQRHPYLIVGWLWYLGTLAPVIGLVQFGGHGMADRFTYVPLIGLFIIVAWGAPQLVRPFPYGKSLLAITATVLLLGFTMCTWLYLHHWKNSIMLYEHTIRVTANNWLVHNNLGVALVEQGRVEEAVGHYRKAQRINPNYAKPHYNMGVVLAGQGMLKEAIGHYNQALRLKPDYIKAHNDLGVALVKHGRLEEATAHFRETLRLSPNYAEAHNNLGNALVQQGKLDLAVPHLYEALRLVPDFAEAHNNLAVALARQGRLEEAAKHYSEAARLYPDSAEVHNNLAVALVSLGRVDEAVPHYFRAVELKPDYAEAYNNLGNALAQLGQLQEAIASYKKALELKPDYAKAHNNLGVAWARMGEVEKAIVQFKKTLQLQPDYAQARKNLDISLQEQTRIVEQLDSNTKP